MIILNTIHYTLYRTLHNTALHHSSLHWCTANWPVQFTGRPRPTLPHCPAATPLSHYPNSIQILFKSKSKSKSISKSICSFFSFVVVLCWYLPASYKNSGWYILKLLLKTTQALIMDSFSCQELFAVSYWQIANQLVTHVTLNPFFLHCLTGRVTLLLSCPMVIWVINPCLTWQLSHCLQIHVLYVTAWAKSGVMAVLWGVVIRVCHVPICILHG